MALLPFVDEKRLHKALKDYYPLLTPAEIQRNVRGDERLYISKHHDNHKFLTGLYNNGIDPNVETDVLIDGMQGRVLLAEDNVKEVIYLFFLVCFAIVTSYTFTNRISFLGCISGLSCNGTACSSPEYGC